MRTKALLCAAAILAAGVATSMAQSNVYSLNVVGYISQPLGTNVTTGLTNGFNMVAVQLDTGTNVPAPGHLGNNNLTNVFGSSMPNGTRIYGFNASSATYSFVTYLATSQTWNGDAANKAGVTAALQPGGGVWILLNGTNGQGTLLPFIVSGQVVEGTNVLSVVGAPGASKKFQMMSIIPPLSTGIESGMGYHATQGDQVYFFNPVAQSYSGGLKTRLAASWNGGEPTPNISQAFWLASTVNTNWTQTYTVPRP